MPIYLDRLTSFQKVLTRLNEGLALEEYSVLKQDGVIHRCEFAIELGWRLLRVILKYSKIEAMNPQQVIKEAFINKLISNYEVWEEMLELKNIVSFEYDDYKSMQIFEMIRNQYIHELNKLENSARICLNLGSRVPVFK